MNALFDVIGSPGSPSVWEALCREASVVAATEPELASLAAVSILNHRAFSDALSYQLARKLGDHEVGAMALRDAIDQAYRADASIWQAAEDDLRAAVDQDPACRGFLKPFLFYKGFLAIQTHRFARSLFLQGRKALASHLQSRSSELFHVDVHPAARIGRGVFIDHGTGVIIGETAVIGDRVCILQDVTLGGTGAEPGERHPKVGDGVLLSAGAQVLGDVEIGAHAKIAAGSLVLQDVPPGCTAVGVPARLVNCPSDE